MFSRLLLSRCNLPRKNDTRSKSNIWRDLLRFCIYFCCAVLRVGAKSAVICCQRRRPLHLVEDDWRDHYYAKTIQRGLTTIHNVFTLALLPLESRLIIFVVASRMCHGKSWNLSPNNLECKCDLFRWSCNATYLPWCNNYKTRCTYQ